MPSPIDLIEADKALPVDQRLFYEEDLAGCYIMLGKKEKALDEIERHFNQPPKMAPNKVRAASPLPRFAAESVRSAAAIASRARKATAEVAS